MITNEQKELKAGRLGASQVAAALGLSPFQTPAQLAMEILGRIPAQVENDAMRGGNIMEPAIAKLYTSQTGIDIFPDNTTYTHPEYDWLICHPDYYKPCGLESRTLIEIKNVGARQRYRWDDGVPVHVVAQVVLQSLLTGCTDVEVVAFFGGWEVEIFPLTITEKQQESLLYKVAAFWVDWIEKNMIPPVCDKDLEMIKTLYPTSDNVEEATATPKVMEDVKSFREYKILRNQMDKTIGTLEAKIRLMMGGSAILLNPDGTREFTYKQAKHSVKTDWENMVLELCDEYEVDSLRYDNFLNKNTKTKEGSRRFLDKHVYDKD